MNEQIMQWASRELYANKLQADVSVATHLLNQLPGTRTDDNTTHSVNTPLHIIIITSPLLELHILKRTITLPKKKRNFV
jgi:hypothetical protein